MNKRNVISLLAVFAALLFFGFFAWALFNHKTVIVMTYLITSLVVAIFIFCAKVYIEVQLYYHKKEIEKNER